MTSPFVRLGVMPLTDAAPLVVAEAKGFFDDEGLTVELSFEQAWSSIRDKVRFDALDGAQMLAPMPIAMAVEVAPDLSAPPVLAVLTLSVHGNGITVSERLADEILALDPVAFASWPITAAGLARVAAARRERGQPRLVLAAVFPWSTHYYQLRRWLRSGGVDPDREVEIVIVPPPRTAALLSAGRIDGYCVGEPWNQLAVRAGLGRMLTSSLELSPGIMEKVLGVSAAWAAANPETLHALLRAVIRAQAWLTPLDHRLEAARILVESGLLDGPFDVVASSLIGTVRDGIRAEPLHLPATHLFGEGGTAAPSLSDARYWAEEMRLAGQLPGPVPDTLLREIHPHRPYDLAVRSLEAERGPIGGSRPSEASTVDAGCP